MLIPINLTNSAIVERALKIQPNNDLIKKLTKRYQEEQEMSDKQWRVVTNVVQIYTEIDEWFNWNMDKVDNSVFYESLYDQFKRKGYLSPKQAMYLFQYP